MQLTREIINHSYWTNLSFYSLKPCHNQLSICRMWLKLQMQNKLLVIVIQFSFKHPTSLPSWKAHVLKNLNGGTTFWYNMLNQRFATISEMPSLKVSSKNVSWVIDFLFYSLSLPLYYCYYYNIFFLLLIWLISQSSHRYALIYKVLLVFCLLFVELLPWLAANFIKFNNNNKQKIDVEERKKMSKGNWFLCVGMLNDIAGYL